MALFFFGKCPKVFDSALYAQVAPDILTSDDLLLDLKNKLRLPDYFGFNWNALYDCLKDFHWVEEDAVILNHPYRLKLPSADAGIYADILNDAVAFWQREGRIEFCVIFNEGDRQEILSYLP
ncbi:barstar family protein [Rhizobium sp. ZPR3]|uniref:barstar family protein n=1 Tax=unclassified Rhizobium TaxID=2613769 RepID=UPI0032EC85C4